MTPLPGMAGLADRYDGFILDLWGVIHDGVQPVRRRRRLPAAAAGRRQALRAAVQRAAPGPRRGGDAAQHGPGAHPVYRADDLGRGGAPGPARPHGPVVRRPRPRVWHLGPERDRNVMDGLDLEPVATPAQAEFVLNTGPDDHRGPQDVAAFEDVLHRVRAPRPADDLRQSGPGGHPRRRARDLRRRPGRPLSSRWAARSARSASRTRRSTSR